MGRPVNKRYFGALGPGETIAINVQVGANAESEEGYIISQRSETKFLVNDAKAGTKQSVGGAGTGNVSICTLVDKASGGLDADEMSINGTISGSGGNQVRVAKLYNRTCRDFDNNRYTWEVQNDSTETILVLTAI
jgi:hypothetical protein